MQHITTTVTQAQDHNKGPWSCELAINGAHCATMLIILLLSFYQQSYTIPSYTCLVFESRKQALSGDSPRTGIKTRVDEWET